MSVTIKRNTDWVGRSINVAIKLNDEKIAKIGYNQELKLDIPNESAQLKVSQQGTKSNIVEVKDGDVVEITTSKWAYLIVLLPAFLVMLPIFSFNMFLRLISIIFLSIISIFFIKGFNLEILDNRRSNLSSE
ncbi:hypothetical protein [Carnobacterium mobile]|uniref:hypothetical protein n=1 Tax=Carnobacterium mobile TaxID=2750 RepID=UPI001867D190|nr:hypothetical protein [Carnobacterium mobile]